jgi:hypothetical protein
MLVMPLAHRTALVAVLFLVGICGCEQGKSGYALEVTVPGPPVLIDTEHRYISGHDSTGLPLYSTRMPAWFVTSFGLRNSGPETVTIQSLTVTLTSPLGSARPDPATADDYRCPIVPAPELNPPVLAELKPNGTAEIPVFCEKITATRATGFRLRGSIIVNGWTGTALSAATRLDVNDVAFETQ